MGVLLPVAKAASQLLPLPEVMCVDLELAAVVEVCVGVVLDVVVAADAGVTHDGGCRADLVCGGAAAVAAAQLPLSPLNVCEPPNWCPIS